MLKLQYILIVMILCRESVSAQTLWGDLKPGKYKMGFRVIKERDRMRNNRPIVLCMWYPASNTAENFLLKEYLFTGIINGSFSNPTQHQKDSALSEFHHVIQLPFLLGLENVPAEKFNAAMELPVRAAMNAPPIEQKFPLVVVSSEPESLSVSCEYLASNGFVVIVVHAPYDQVQPHESLIYDNNTKDLEWLIQYISMLQLKNIDLAKIGALGFGGGIMPSFFLTMKTDKIKALVNLEGGVFQGASLTTKSVDYWVEKMRTPMLHIVTYGTKKDESAAEINAIKSAPIYRVLVEDKAVKHQDFSIFGRIALHGLGMRGEISADVEKAYLAAHGLMLDFFDQLLRKSEKEFQPSDLPSGLRVEK